MATRKNKPIRGTANVRKRAKELRKLATPAEKILWDHLRNRRFYGLKFRRQHPIGNFIIDFYCPAHRLVVEIDGDIHQFQKSEDQARTDRLEDMGYKIIRIWNHEIERHLDSVLDAIAEQCGLPSPRDGRRVGDEGSN